MKKLPIIVAFIMSLVVIGISQTPSPSPAQSQPSTEDIKQAKENLKVLLNDQKPQATPEQGKSVADVMDKGLDMLSGYVGTLEGVVSKYAPEVWRIMIMQQYAKAVAYPLYWGILLCCILLFRKGAKNYCGVQKGQNIFVPSEDEETGRTYRPYKITYWLRLWFVGVIPTVALIPTIIIFTYCLTEAVMIFINPEYYALKDIIHMLR